MKKESLKIKKEIQLYKDKMNKQQEEQNRNRHRIHGKAVLLKVCILYMYACVYILLKVCILYTCVCVYTCILVLILVYAPLFYNCIHNRCMK